MNFTVGQVAAHIGGEVDGDLEAQVSGVGKIEGAKPGELTFLANPKYEKFIYTTEATAVIVSADFSPAEPVKAALIRVGEPYAAFAALLDLYHKYRYDQVGIEDPSFIHPSAKIGEGVYIGAFAYIGEGAVIGDGAKIFPNCYVGKEVVVGASTVLAPNVTVYHGCKLGERCLVQSGAVIGSDGFGFSQDAEGNFEKVPQIGVVIIEDDVEIGANTCIDRATMGATHIKKGVKLDNLIQIAHNVELGENTALASQAGIAGSTKVGKNVKMGGQVGVNGHINIADNTMIAAQSGIPNNIKRSGQVLLGSPAIDLEDFKKCYFGFRKLPQILKRLEELERELEKTKK